MERAELQHIEQQVNREVKARFPAGTIRRVTLLQPGDDPAIGPGEFLLRVIVRAADVATADEADPQRSLEAWAESHEPRMRRLRRELSLRLPEARLLEFTTSDAAEAPRVTMPDDPALTSEPLPSREVVTTVLAVLRTSYVFPDRAEQAATAIEARLAAGEYDDLDEPALAKRLTSHLYETCADKHLAVRVRPPDPPGRERGPGPAGPGADRREWERPGNFGIRRAEILDGNVGYLDLHGVAPPERAGQVIAAAMELIAGTYALIIDLRRNHGGSPHGVAFWCSYLFPGAGTHLSDIFEADTGQTTQFWSLAYVPGARYLDRPVYLLTSSETFSGGEDFCYTLQALGRARVIGETTGGGAHPTRRLRISATWECRCRSPGRSTRLPGRTGRAPGWCRTLPCPPPRPTAWRTAWP
jgi:hypothetical protein